MYPCDKCEAVFDSQHKWSEHVLGAHTDDGRAATASTSKDVKPIVIDLTDVDDYETMLIVTPGETVVGLPIFKCKIVTCGRQFVTEAQYVSHAHRPIDVGVGKRANNRVEERQPSRTVIKMVRKSDEMRSTRANGAAREVDDESSITIVLDDQLSTEAQSQASMTRVFDAAYYAARPHRCAECAQAFTIALSLTRHGEREHNASKSTVPVPTTVANLREATTTHTAPTTKKRLKPKPAPPKSADRPHQCPHCDWSFKNRSHLRDHALTYHDDASFGCPFTRPALNVVRDAEYYSKRPHRCPTCPAAFANPQGLRKHDRYTQCNGGNAATSSAKPSQPPVVKTTPATSAASEDEADRRFKCPKCAVTFRRASYAREHCAKFHQLVVTLDDVRYVDAYYRRRPFHCTSCSYATRAKHDMVKHYNRKHKQQVNADDIVAVRAWKVEPTTVRRTITTTAIGTRVACTECDRSYTTMKYYKQHMKKVHGITVTPTTANRGGNAHTRNPKDTKPSLDHKCRSCPIRFSTLAQVGTHEGMKHKTDGPPRRVCKHCRRDFSIERCIRHERFCTKSRALLRQIKLEAHTVKRERRDSTVVVNAKRERRDTAEVQEEVREVSRSEEELGATIGAEAQRETEAITQTVDGQQEREDIGETILSETEVRPTVDEHEEDQCAPLETTDRLTESRSSTPQSLQIDESAPMKREIVQN